MLQNLAQTRKRALHIPRCDPLNINEFVCQRGKIRRQADGGRPSTRRNQIVDKVGRESPTSCEVSGVGRAKDQRGVTDRLFKNRLPKERIAITRAFDVEGPSSLERAVDQSCVWYLGGCADLRSGTCKRFSDPDGLCQAVGAWIDRIEASDVQAEPSDVSERSVEFASYLLALLPVLVCRFLDGQLGNKELQLAGTGAIQEPPESVSGTKVRDQDARIDGYAWRDALPILTRSIFWHLAGQRSSPSVVRSQATSPRRTYSSLRHVPPAESVRACLPENRVRRWAKHSASGEKSLG